MRRLLVLLLVVASACSSNGDRRAEPAATTTTTIESTTTTSSATTTTTSTTLPGAACPPTGERVRPPADRPQYDLALDVRLAENAVTGTVDVRFVPDLPVDRLVFRLWPNGPRLRNAGAR